MFVSQGSLLFQLFLRRYLRWMQKGCDFPHLHESRKESAFEGGVICLFCSGGDTSCPPGLPANNPKQVCAYTIWSLPPESEPREAPRWRNLPLALTGWGPWHLSVHPLSSLDPTIHTKPLLGVHLGPLALNSVPTTLKNKAGSEKLNVRASSCQLQRAV